MGKKGRTVFLAISFTVFAKSFLPPLVSLIGAMVTGTSDPNKAGNIVALQSYPFFAALPLYAEELVWIRSTYKLLKHRPTGLVKVCYLLSSGLLLAVIIVKRIPFAGRSMIEYVFRNDLYAASVCSGIELTVLLLSFILSSIPINTGRSIHNANGNGTAPADPAAEPRPENSDAE